VDRFDAGRGNAFTSYAVPTIIGELKRHFRDRAWEVRPPRQLLELTLRVDRVATDMSQCLGRAPTIGELARATGAGEEEVLEALQANTGRSSLSLQADVGGREAEPLQDTLPVTDPGYAAVEDRALLDGLLGYLSAREREVLTLRFERDLTQPQIGALLGISQMQVSRILRDSIERLRTVVDQQRKLLYGPSAAAR
jgi:RNA polymerase sigma-B factor